MVEALPLLAYMNRPPELYGIAEQFVAFHLANPNVYALLRRFARLVKGAGYDCYGISSIFERVRWHVQIDTVSEDGFVLNNNHRAYYARLLMHREPALEGMFQVRKLRIDNWEAVLAAVGSR